MEWRVDQRPAYSVLKVKLGPGEAVTSEAGAYLLHRGDVEVETGTGGLLRGVLRAALAGEKLFLNTFRARTPAEVWLAPSLPGDISYIPLRGDAWIVQDSGYLAHHGDVEVSVAWRGLKGLLAEGELVWLKLAGEGGVWVNSYGGLEVLRLGAGERVTVDNFHFVAMPADTKYTIRKLGGWKTLLLGGEGLVVEVEGPATLVLQTRTLPQLAGELAPFLGEK